MDKKEAARAIDELLSGPHRPTYEDEQVKLFAGDSTWVLPDTIEDKSVDLILCDLPYGEATGKTRAYWDTKYLNYDDTFKEYRRIIKPNGVIVLHGNEPFSSMVRMKLADIYKYDIKWIKTKTTGFANANYRPMNKYEDIMVFSYANASSGGKRNPMTYNPQGLVPYGKTKKNSARRHGLVMDVTNNTGKNNSLLQEGTEYVQKFTNYPSNVVHFANPKKYLHPTQKPVELLEYLIKTYSNEGDVVLDNCMGSGSTGVACKNTGRKFIGIEIFRPYYDIAERRIRNDDK